MSTRRDLWLMWIDAAIWVLGTAFVAVGFILEIRSGRSFQDAFSLTWREVAMPEDPPRVGQALFPVEVTNVSPHGFWLFVDDQELLVPFTDFP